MKTIWIDSAPLIASPVPTGIVVEVEHLEKFDTKGDAGKLYIWPPGGSPLYIAPGWVREKPKDKTA